MVRDVWIQQLQKTAPKVHCLTNPVSIRDVANVLLAAGGSAIMGEDQLEVQELTELCQATLLNTGVPNEDKLCACMIAGIKANELEHPVVLDPVGVGASQFRSRTMKIVLKKVEPSVIRCNQEEACALLNMESTSLGGVESSVELEQEVQRKLAIVLAQTYNCTALISGEADAISDGERSMLVTGGDARIKRITGSGCMLSALCALLSGTGLAPYEAACAAGTIWKESAEIAGARTDKMQGGIGSFYVHLFDALDGVCHGTLPVKF